MSLVRITILCFIALMMTNCKVTVDGSGVADIDFDKNCLQGDKECYPGCQSPNTSANSTTLSCSGPIYYDVRIQQNLVGYIDIPMQVEPTPEPYPTITKEIVLKDYRLQLTKGEAYITGSQKRIGYNQVCFKGFHGEPMGIDLLNESAAMEFGVSQLICPQGFPADYTPIHVTRTHFGKIEHGFTSSCPFSRRVLKANRLIEAVEEWVEQQPEECAVGTTN